MLIFVFKGRPLFGVEAHSEVHHLPEEQVVIMHLLQRYEHTTCTASWIIEAAAVKRVITNRQQCMHARPSPNLEIPKALKAAHQPSVS